MLSKSYPIFHVFARQKEEKTNQPLSREQWINADRIVMIVLFASVIIGALIFS